MSFSLLFFCTHDPCLIFFRHRTPRPYGMDPHGKIVEASILILCDILLVIVFFIGTASNIIVLSVFYRRPGLRTLSNR